MKEAMMLLLPLCILVLLAGGIEGQNIGCGNAIRFYGTNGTINSPNYPQDYYNNANCTYYLMAPGLCNMTLTIRDLGLESCCDWVELSCRSHSVALPTRYTGRASALLPITFSPCSQVLIRFYSDSSVVFQGFSIDYQNTPIVCQDNCTLLSNSYGYICSCDNETGIVMPTMDPNPRCLGGCDLNTYGSYRYCSCSVYGTTTRVTCPRGCYTDYDFNNNPVCNCPSSTTVVTCAPGCHRAVDWTGNSYCRCTTPTGTPMSCSSGCFVDYDYWDRQFCNCPYSTQPPIWCGSGCTSDVNVYGNRYCNCPTTTPVPCYSPCYYNWNYTGSTSFRYCYCPPTTTAPPATGCNQTLAAATGFVTSPNYPRTYPKGIDCYQYIDIPSATAINLRIVDVNVYYYDSYNCMYEYIQVIGCDGSLTIFCTSYNIPSSGLSFQCTDDHTVTVVFTSYQSSYYSYRGFKLSYTSTTASNCSSGSSYLLPDDTGIITSPNYPNSFPKSSECTNYLYPEDSETRITIVFEQISLGSTSQCTNAFLRLICEGDDSQSMTVCGNGAIPPKTFQCSALTIWFKSNGSDGSSSTRFFRIKYIAKRSPLASTTIPSVVGETDLPMSAKLGIGLGIGIGGFFLLLLLVLIVVLIINGQRKSERRERFRLEDLAVICSNIRNGTGPDSGGTVRMAMDPSNIYTTEGFSNPLAMANSTDSIPTLNEKMKA